MRRITRRAAGFEAATAFLLVLVMLGSAAAAGAAVDATSAPGEALIKVRGGAGTLELASIDALADAAADVQLSQLESGTVRRIRSRSLTTEALVAALSRHPNVVYAEPNYIVHTTTLPNDPRFGELWGMRNTGQAILGFPGTAGADIKAEPAWSVTTGTHAVVVGVVDTGIDYTHADLAANVWTNPGGIGGCAAGTHGYNAITRVCDPRDDNNHGTHVSGTIGAVGDNALGVVGVNWTTTIMGLKFLGSSGSGSLADAITAIDFAVNAKIAGVNVRILSNSWGGGGFSQGMLDEINKANSHDILFVAAAGNSGANLDTSPFYPASYAAPNVVAVAATDNNDRLAGFSNFGAATVHLGAPGVNVLSTQPGGFYQYLSGTSMATPHVSGAAALVLSRSTLGTAQLKSALLANVDAISSLAGKTITGGRLDVCKAIAATSGGTNCGGGGVSPPSVTTNAATGLGQAAATLNAAVNPNGSPTTVYYDYGPGTSYGTAVTYGNIGSGTTSVSTPLALAALSCNTTYHFRARAANGGGTANGGDRSFTTSSCPSGGPGSFYTLAPCRVWDTRGGGLGGGIIYEFGLAGFCGIPAAARSVAVNVTVVGASAGGFLAIWPARTSSPGTSTINFTAGRTLANNAVVLLAPGVFGSAGAVWIEAGGMQGSFDLVIDVSGYFD